MMKSYYEVLSTLFPSAIPYKKIFILVFIWMTAVVLNYIAKNYFDLKTSTTTTFPFSVFTPMFNFSGVPYALLFIFVIYIVLKHKLYSSLLVTYTISLFLIILGNMSLGNIELAFINPTSGGSIQYYHDAIKIDSWKNWLSGFNQFQESLLCHGKTHPPGAELIIKIFFPISKSPLFISMVFLLISSVSIILIYNIFIELGKDKFYANKMALLYAVLPSVNIYSLATLDAVIATLVNIIILGHIILIKDINKSRFLIWSLINALSLALVSFLTFGSIYVWAVTGVFSFYLLFFHNNKTILMQFIISFIIFLIIVLFLDHVYNFNYIESFITASKLENPNGFMLLTEPSNYIATRIENIFEIAIFLSFGLIAILTTVKYKTYDTYHIFALIAVMMLLLMFLSGAYKTGETARACLFIVGFILFFLKDISSSLLTSLISFAAIQTIVMQLFGFYFW